MHEGTDGEHIHASSRSRMNECCLICVLLLVAELLMVSLWASGCPLAVVSCSLLAVKCNKVCFQVSKALTQFGCYFYRLIPMGDVL